MSFLLSWFKSEKKKEIESLEVEKKKIEVEILRESLAKSKEEKEVVENRNCVKDAKPYRGLRLINDVLTVVLNDGTFISRPSSSQELFNIIRNSTTEQEILDNLVDKNVDEDIKNYEDEVERCKYFAKSIDNLIVTGDFIARDSSVYMKGINRTIPLLLLEKFGELVSSEDPEDKIKYEGLKKFWVKCCLNPNARSAEDLYEFLSFHNFKIDKYGNFYAYRRVVSKKGPADKNLIEFISNVYIKVKAVWKKKPENYRVEDINGEYKFRDISHTPKGNIIGNLDTLYKDLPYMSKETYTSAHTGKEDYRVGDVISMPRYLGDDNNNVSCSKGFHGASKKYDYTGFGDTPILMIINPMDVLAVPVGEIGKLRTCRWFFATTLPEDEKYILDDDDFDVTELGDIFEEKCMVNLHDHITNSFAEEVKRHTYTIPSISTTDIADMVDKLNEMSLAISKRVVKVN